MHRTFEGANTTVIHGDAVEVLGREVADGSVELIFADPPYNIGKRFSQFLDKWPSDAEYAKWCESWLAVYLRKLKDCGSLYVITSTQSMRGRANTSDRSFEATSDWPNSQTCL